MKIVLDLLETTHGCHSQYLHGDSMANYWSLRENYSDFVFHRTSRRVPDFPGSSPFIPFELCVSSN